MPTLKQEFIYFNDAVGRTLPNAKMYFYEAGTTTPKNTFTSKSLANANQHPVVADAAGRFPVIWLGVGGYRVVVEDENGVTIHDRDDINVADEQLNATSSIYFNTLADLKLLIAQNGQSVNPGLGDALRTAGETSATDGLGAEWVVVAAGTGTADDDLFVDLDNGLQAQRLFNQVYGRKTDYLQVTENLDDLGNKATARTNLDVYSKSETYSTAQADDKFLDPTSVTLIWDKTPTTVIDMDTDIDGGNPGTGFYIVVPDNGTTHRSLIYIETGANISYGTSQATGNGISANIRQARKNGPDLSYIDLDLSAFTVTLVNILEVYKVK